MAKKRTKSTPPIRMMVAAAATKVLRDPNSSEVAKRYARASLKRRRKPHGE
jgi:hypothetical protein